MRYSDLTPEQKSIVDKAFSIDMLIDEMSTVIPKEDKCLSLADFARKHNLVVNEDENDIYFHTPHFSFTIQEKNGKVSLSDDIGVFGEPGTEYDRYLFTFVANSDKPYNFEIKDIDELYFIT